MIHDARCMIPLLGLVGSFDVLPFGGVNNGESGGWCGVGGIIGSEGGSTTPSGLRLCSILGVLMLLQVIDDS